MSLIGQMVVKIEGEKNTRREFELCWFFLNFCKCLRTDQSVMSLESYTKSGCSGERERERERAYTNQFI